VEIKRKTQGPCWFWDRPDRGLPRHQVQKPLGCPRRFRMADHPPRDPILYSDRYRDALLFVSNWTHFEAERSWGGIGSQNQNIELNLPSENLL